MVLDQSASLMLMAGAVAVLPMVARLCWIPSTVAEILFGIALGKSLLHIELGGEWLPFLAELGFLVLMFQAGMEINFSMLAKQSRKRLFFQLALFCAVIASAVAVAILLEQGIFMALVLSTTSLGLVMPTLKETDTSGTALGQGILIAATLADFLTLLGIMIYVLYADYGLSMRLLSPLPLFLGFMVALLAARRWAWWHPNLAERLLAPGNSREPGVRISFALLFLFVGLSELINLEPVLGAFMGGAILSFVFREKEALESKISAIGFGFLVPLFFIHVGMSFDVRNVLDSSMLPFLLWLLLAAFAVKTLPCLVLYPLWGMRLGDGFKAGILLSSRLSLIVAAAAIGVQKGFMPPKMRDAIVLLALCTCFLGPIGYKLLNGRSGRRHR